jgi:mono/diheme cytochrome c family protein
MSRRSRFVALAALLLVAAAPVLAAGPNETASPDTITFHEDVEPILQRSCQGCHRPEGVAYGGMKAPMALTTYEETRPWARSIARQVEAKDMPPWFASDHTQGQFTNERVLTAEEIDTIVGWAKTGARRGDPANAPEAIEWPAGWLIGEPDLVLDLAEPFWVDDDVKDLNISLKAVMITEEMLPEPRWIKAVEFRPGGPVVHHIIARPLGGIAPGNDPTVHTDGFGTLLKPGTTLRWQMHYHKEAGPGTGVWDRSSVAVRFYPEDYKPDYVMQSKPMGKFDFEIPAGESNYVARTSTTFDRDSLLLGYTPHMHLRGKAARYVAKYPDGTQEVLLDVPRYDFNWQTHYKYHAGGKRIPAGTEIELTMAWDNSADNPSNPDPTATVVYGGPTTAEMMFGFVSYADAEPGYDPSDTGFLSQQRFNREDFRKSIKERFGVDWDSLSEEEQGKLFRRLRQQQRRNADSDGSEGTVSGR